MRKIVLFSCLAGLLLPALAAACVNSTIREYAVRPALQRAQRVERRLAQDNPRAAYQTAWELRDVTAEGVALRRFDGGDDWWQMSGSETEESAIEYAGSNHAAQHQTALRERAQLLHAICMIRLDGNVSRQHRPARSVHPSVREQNLRSALSDLEGLEDPRAEAFRAEGAFTLNRDAREETLATLRRLASEDMLVDAFSWRLLAQLSDSEEERENAATRCEAAAVGRGARRCRSER